MEEVAAHPEITSLEPTSVMTSSPGKPLAQQTLSVLHVHSGNLFGGIERAILTCVENLPLAPSTEFEFALCFDGQLREQLASAGQTIHNLPEVRARNPLTIVTARRQLTTVLRRKPYAVVICHSPWTHSIFAPAIERAGVPELFWAHDHFSGKHWLERWARRSQPGFVISNGHYCEESVTRIFPGVGRQVMRYPVSSHRVRLSPDDRLRLRSELKTPDDAVVIVQVSRMEPWKGHNLLLESAATMSQDLPWAVWFIGGAQRKQEETYLSDLKAKAASLGISDRVRFAGQRPDVPHLLAAADIFCQPNQAPEPFGLVFVEALSQALPVVTFAMGGPAEIVDDTCGVFVPPGRTDELASQLERLIRDSDLRRRLGEAGPARAKALCDPSVILPQLEKVLSQLSAAKRV